MLAIIMSEPGDIDVLQLKEVETPSIAAPGDVLVRLRAAGVNPADMHVRRRAFSSTIDWLIQGIDGAGVVEAVGEGVTRFAVGDEVWYTDGGFDRHQGSYAQYKVVDERFLARKPAVLDFTSAAAVPTVLLTAWEALKERAGLTAGQFVLVHGGAGGVGHMAVQLARAWGARVAVTVSTEQKAAVAKGLGAECVIRYREEDVGAAVRAWSGKNGADIVFDTVGGANFAASVDLVASYGVLVNCVVSPWPEGTNGGAEFRNIRLGFENVGLPQLAGDVAARCRQTQILEEAAAMFDAGMLRVVVGAVYPLADAAEAQRALSAGEITGRVALSID